VPVLISLGGGTESSKLYAGVDVVVVGRGTLVVACGTEVTRFGFVDAMGGPALFDPPLHAPRTKIPATRTLVARFPTPAPYGTRHENRPWRRG
jgi:hypothetical protein